MRLPEPNLPHPPEIYAAIIVEHGGKPLAMAARLEEFGWPLADAAWAAANWDAAQLAAAIAHERKKRGQPLISLRAVRSPAASGPQKPRRTQRVRRSPP